MSATTPNPPMAPEGPHRREESAPYVPPPKLSFGARVVANLRDRDKILRFLRTLAWVIPLTLLIWVYAEREQAVTDTVYIPIELSTDEPDCVLSVKNSADRTIAVEVWGARAGVDNLKTALRASPLKIPVPATQLPALGASNKDVTVLIADAIQSNDVFRKSALKVTRVSTPLVTATVDRYVTRSIPVEAWDDDVTKLGLLKVTIAERIQVKALSSAFEKGTRQMVRPDLAPLRGLAPGAHPNIELTLAYPGPDPLMQAPRKIKTSVEIVAPKRDVVTREISSLPIWTLTPTVVAKNHTVEYEPREIKNIVVSGPPALLDLVESGKAEPRPCVILQITDADLSAKEDNKAVRKITAKDVLLPEGLKVEEFKGNTEITFWLSSRSSN